MCLAVPGKVLAISGDDPVMRIARVDFGGIVKEINLAYAPEAAVGDYVLVHVGFAITVIDEEEAAPRLRASRRRSPTSRRSSVRGGDRAMKFRDEYRDPEAARRLRGRHRAGSPRGRGRSWRSAAARPTPSSATASTSCCPPDVTLVHGPGCPVCVTPVEMIDKAIEIAGRPGRRSSAPSATCCACRARASDLLAVKAARRRRAHRLFAARRASTIARDNPGREVVFFAVGFETTAPANAMAVYQAQARGPAQFLACSSRTCWCRRRCEAILSLADEPRAGLPRRRPCLHGHGLRGV